MQNIPKEYTLLFNALADTEESLRRLSERLISIQQQAEDLFLERCEREVSYACASPVHGVK